LGWRFGGLAGVGIAYSVAALYDLAVALIVYGRLYGCRLSSGTIRLSVVQFMLLAVNVFVCFQSLLWLRLSVGIPLFIVSSIYSFQLLRKRIKRG
jgi:hypothetical protein